MSAVVLAKGVISWDIADLESERMMNMHEDWCGKACGDCKMSCALDESMPCSPCCELLGDDGGPMDHAKCLKAGCDAIE